MDYIETKNRVLSKEKDEGNRLVVPGGKNSDADLSAASFGMVVRYNDAIKQREYVLVPKLPVPNGGFMRNDDELEYPGEPEQVTMYRELMEETGIKPKPSIHITTNIVDDTIQIGKMHMQLAYLVLEYDDRNIHQNPPMDMKTGVPIWVPESIIRNHLWEGHLWILNAVEEYLLHSCQLVRRVHVPPDYKKKDKTKKAKVSDLFSRERGKNIKAYAS